MYAPRFLPKLCLVLATALPAALAQTADITPAHSAPAAAASATVVPMLVRYSGIAVRNNGNASATAAIATFLIYKEEQGGEPLWIETQSVAIDTAGRYEVYLGSTYTSGLPPTLFGTGEARWLEVQVAGEAPGPRTLLTSVPYAMKAADAATLGGLPASAFALAGTPTSVTGPSSNGITSDTVSNVTTTGGTNLYLPRFSGASTVVNSEIYDSGTSVGIGNVPNPGAKLDVNGPMIMRGSMTVSRTGNATPSKAYPSYGFDFFSNAYNSSTKAADNPYFQMQSEPTGNNTASPSATFNLLFSNNGAAAAETGFYINPTGTLHFAPSQTFPGAVTSVGLTAPANDFTVTGSPVTSAGAFNLTWNTPPTSANTGSAIIKRDSNGGFVAGAITANSLTASGTVAANSLTVYGTSYIAGANLAGPIGVGTNSPAAQVNLNANNAANADALLLGNTSSKGLQLRDNGSGVDIESIGVPLNINYLTKQQTIINPNGGSVVINDNRANNGQFALTVGGIVYPGTSNNFSADFEGIVQMESDLSVNGGLYVYGSKNFRIDHPMDPANKYLVHAAIESSEVLNQYSGNVTTDEVGLATVHLPEWFEVENTDFRYQLTVIGGRFAQAVVSKEVEHNQFTINTNVPGVKVSWQVTARRNDEYMKQHPFVAERQKPANERGTYILPELYGQPESKHTGGPRRAAPVTAPMQAPTKVTNKAIAAVNP